MALITEDGTAKADAESLASVAFADTHHSNRGNTAWAALTTAAKEQALRKATDYIGATYGRRWDGARVSSLQALDWPRYDVPKRDGVYSRYAGYGYDTYYVSDAVPAAVQRACADLALRASVAALAPDRTQAVKRKRVEGAVEIEYQDYSDDTPLYPAIDGALAPFLTAGGSARLVRG